MTEKDIERKFDKWAGETGWKVRKFSSPGQNGALDKVYHWQGITAYIEWKQPKGKLSRLQQKEMRELTLQKIPNASFDNFESAKQWLERLKNASRN